MGCLKTTFELRPVPRVTQVFMRRTICFAFLWMTSSAVGRNSPADYEGETM